MVLEYGYRQVASSDGYAIPIDRVVSSTVSVVYTDRAGTSRIVRVTLTAGPPR